MQLTDAQTDLMGLGQRPIRKHSIDLVRLATSRAVSSTVAHLAARESKINSRVPLSVKVCAVSQWDVMTSLVEIGGPDVWGSGHLDIACRFFRKVRTNDQRAVCLWLDKAGAMSPVDQENLAARLTWVATQQNFKLRLIYLMQKVIVWNSTKQEEVRDWNLSSHVAAHAETWDFNSDGFEESDVSEDQGAAVKIA